jgi:hypothetical protein
MIRDRAIYIVWVFVSAVFILQACTTLQTFPHAARAGDTISIAVGSAVGMTKDSSNTTAVYVADSGGTYPVTIRSVFNLYPDKKSALYQSNSQTLNIIASANHEAWQTVMVIDLPSDIPVGTGSIHITSVATYPSVTSHINDMAIGLQIIPGSGESNPFTYEFGTGSSLPGKLSLLEPLPHALITPPVNGSYYGAIQMKLTLSTSAPNPLTEADLRVEFDDMTPGTVSNRNVSWSINNNELTVMLISPGGGLQAVESRFSVIPYPKFNFTSVPTITSVQFFDVDGQLVTGPVASDFSVALF